MQREIYRKIVEESTKPEAIERSIAYLAEHLGKFLKKQEVVLICFLEHKEGSLGWLMEQAVLRCDAKPVIWGPDHRWKTLFQQAFFSHASAIIGPPLVILGLTKLMKYNNLPLNIRKVITAGYPCLDWMIDGIVKGFDCEVGGCFSLGESGAVAGFACGHSWGIHLRSEDYAVEIVDNDGNPVANGELGEIVLYPVAHPELRYHMGELARMEVARCECGSISPRLLDLEPSTLTNKDLVALGQYLQSWTSILDCCVSKSESGLEIEIVCFPGEKLPKLPTSAKLIVRPWDPQNDEPFWYIPALNVVKNS